MALKRNSETLGLPALSLDSTIYRNEALEKAWCIPQIQNLQASIAPKEKKRKEKKRKLVNGFAKFLSKNRKGKIQKQER